MKIFAVLAFVFLAIGIGGFAYISMSDAPVTQTTITRDLSTTPEPVTAPSAPAAVAPITTPTPAAPEAVAPATPTESPAPTSETNPE